MNPGMVKTIIAEARIPTAGRMFISVKLDKRGLCAIQFEVPTAN